MNALFKLAVVAGMKSAVAFHVRRGLDVNARGKNGVTPLCLAASAGHAEICELLLENGADPRLLDALGKSAKDYAVLAGHPDLAGRLSDLSQAACDTFVDNQLSDKVELGAPMSTTEQSENIEEARQSKRARLPPMPLKVDAELAVTESDERFLSEIATLSAPRPSEPSGLAPSWVSALSSGTSSLRPADPQISLSISPESIFDPHEDEKSLAVSGPPQVEEAVRATDIADPDACSPPEIPDLVPSEPANTFNPVQMEITVSAALPLEISALSSVLSADGEDSDGWLSWEPEPEATLSVHDESAMVEASKIHQHLSVAVKNNSAEWGSADVDLPRRIMSEIRLPRYLSSLATAGVSLGWVSRDQLQNALSAAIIGDAQQARFASLLLDLGIPIDNSFYGNLATDLVAGIDQKLPEPAWDGDERYVISEFLEPPAELGAITIVRLKELRATSGGSDAMLWKLFEVERRKLLKAVVEVPATLNRLLEVMKPKNGGSDRTPEIDDEEEEDARETTVEIVEIGPNHFEILSHLLAERSGSDRLTDNDVIVQKITDLRLPLARLLASVAERSGPDETHSSRRFKNALRGYERTRENILRNNLSLVVFFAKRYGRSGLGFMDLVQEGSIGLMRAVERFDTAKGKFGSYAALWIRQSIARAVSDSAKTIRIPVHVQDSLRRVSRKRSELTAELSRNPTPEELSARLEYAPAKLSRLEDLNASFRYGHDNVGRISRRELVSRIDPEMSAEDVVGDNQLGRLIEEQLRALDPRQAKVLSLRFGLAGEREHTLEEVGEMYGVTRERIRQIEAKALRRLSHPAVSGTLKVAFLSHFRTDKGR